MSRISDGDSAAVPPFLDRADPAALRGFVCSALSSAALEALGAHLPAIVLLDDFLAWPDLSADALRALVRAWTADSQIRARGEVHRRVADFVLRRLAGAPQFGSVLPFLDFSFLRAEQIRALFALSGPPLEIGARNSATVIDLVTGCLGRISGLRSELLRAIDRAADSAAGGEQTEGSVRAALGRLETAIVAAVADFKAELAAVAAAADRAQAGAAAANEAIDSLRREVAFVKANAAVSLSQRPEILPQAYPVVALYRGCGNVFSEYGRYCAIDSSPRYQMERLRELLTRADEGDAVARAVIWSSDPKSTGHPSITVELRQGLLVSPLSYSLRSPSSSGDRLFMRSWTLEGRVRGEWYALNRQEGTDVLSDGAWHDFAISGFTRGAIDALRLCHDGRNKYGRREMHLGGFRFCGDVIGPREFAAARVADPGVGLREASDAVEPDCVSARLDGSVLGDCTGTRALPTAESPSPRSGASRNLVVVNEYYLLPGARATVGTTVPMFTDLAGIEDVRLLSSSRFGSVRLMRRSIEGGFEYFAAKYYNAGDNRDGLQAFHDRVHGLVSLSHPSVMPIVGLIAPTKAAGPIVLTPYSGLGSLSDVLSRVQRNDLPEFWSDAGKLRMLVSLISGFIYLHSRGVVHREVKPSDLIVQPDGSILICGYLTSVLEEHKFTRASQVGAPSYMAPEVYQDRENERRSRDPKTDVFAFALILYEILCGRCVFPPTCSASRIMLRGMSTKAGRPVIPGGLHPVLQELIAKNWVPATSKRESFDVMWKRLRDIQFQAFPTPNVTFVPCDVAFGSISLH
jgi:hypothetical protein